MTRNKSYREKGKAAFLAAIMVLSVVAMAATFTGAAVAGATTDRTPTDVTVQPGDQVTVTLDVTADQNDGLEVISESFDTELDIVDSSSENTQVLTDNGSWEVVYLQPADSDTIEVTYEVPEGSAGQTFNASGTIVTSNEEVSSGTTTINVEDQTPPADPPEETSIEDLTVTPKDVLDDQLASQNDGLLGVPFGVGPYPDQDELTFGEVTLTHQTVVDFNSTDGETEEIEYDLSETTDEGIEYDADEDEIENAFESVSGIEVTEVTTAPNTIIVDYEAAEDVANAVISFDTVLSIEAPSNGIAEPVSDRIDHTVEGPEGDTESDRYRLTNVGPVVFEESDLSEDYRGMEDAPASDWDGEDAVTAWGGSSFTFLADGQASSIEFHEVTRDNDDQFIVSEETEVLQRGTQPGQVRSIDTSELDNLDGQYFITFNRNYSQQFYVDLRGLDFDASAAADEISTEDNLEVEVSSSDIGTTPAEGAVEAWFFEADDDEVGDVVAVAEGNLDGDGEDTLSVSPQDELTGTGEYYAVVLHEESEIVAETDTVEVTEPLQEDVQIESPQFSDQYARGDIAEFELDLTNTDTATVTLGDREGQQNFEVNITVRDTNDDGTASFKVNTFQLGDGPINNASADEEVYAGVNETEWMSPDREYPHGVFTVDEGTSVVSAEAHQSIRIGGGSNVNEAIRVVISDGGYDLVASPGETPASEEESRATDNSQLRLQPRTTGAIDTWSAPTPNDPADVADIETVDEIATAINESVVTPQNGSLADEDYLIIQAQATGLEGVLATTVEEDLDNMDIEDFLDRSESHDITEAFTASDLVEIRTTQDLNQVREIVQDALANQERNLPEDSTFALPAQLNLLADNENQKVLAGTNDLGSLDEYFVMTPVNNETVADLIEPEGADDVAQDVDAFTDDEIEAVIDIHPNYEPSDFGDEDNDLEGDHQDVRDFFVDNAEFELPTNEPPTQFNTTFELAPEINDDEAEEFPLNDFFAGDSEETLVNWDLVEDEVSLDNLETILEDDEQVDRLFLPPQDNYEVIGETEIAAGTTLQHDTQSDVGETPPFFESGSFQVEYVEGGPNDISFVINESLSERAGQDFTMEIRRANQFGLVTPDGETIQGQITEPAEVIEHTFEDQEGGGEVVDVAAVNVSTAGAVQIQNANGDVLGETLIEEGLNEDVRVLLDTPVEESQELTSVIVTSAGEQFDEGPTNQTAQYTVAGGQATFGVSNLNPVATEVTPGQEITVTADITNNGDISATKTVELRLDGETLTSEDVTLDPTSSQEVSFTVNAPDSTGEYAHSVWTEDDDAVGQLTVAEADTGDDTGDTGDTGNETDTGGDGDADDGGAGFGVAAALIALLGAALLAYRRRAE